MDEERETADSAGATPPVRNPADLLKIRALSVILAIVLVAFALYVVVSEGVLEASPPPYPSESTPLTIQSWGVTWDWGDEESVIDMSVQRLEYANMSTAFTIYDDDSFVKHTGPFLTGEFVDVDAFVVPTTIDEADSLSQLSRVLYHDDGVDVCVIDCYFVSDNTDPLTYDRGDCISIVHLVFEDGVLASTGFAEDTVYEIELMYEGVMTICEGYGFAVHDRVLYSWIDHGEIDDPLS